MPDNDQQSTIQNGLMAGIAVAQGLGVLNQQRARTIEDGLARLEALANVTGPATLSVVSSLADALNGTGQTSSDDKAKTENAPSHLGVRLNTVADRLLDLLQNITAHGIRARNVVSSPQAPSSGTYGAAAQQQG